MEAAIDMESNAKLGNGINNLSTYIVLTPHDGEEREQWQVVISSGKAAQSTEHRPDYE